MTDTSEPSAPVSETLSERPTTTQKTTVKRRPPNAGKGRPAGSKNKFGHDVQRTILMALDRVGGVKYLERQAEANPQAFLQLVGRCVPREMRAEITAELTVRQEIRRNLVDSLVELIQTTPSAEPQRVIDVTPTAHSILETQEPRERIAGSEANYEDEERERELNERLQPGSEAYVPMSEAVRSVASGPQTAHTRPTSGASAARRPASDERRAIATNDPTNDATKEARGYLPESTAAPPHSSGFGE